MYFPFPNIIHPLEQEIANQLYLECSLIHEPQQQMMIANEIYYHCAGRKFDGFNMHMDYFDNQLEPDKLLRQSAYMYGLKYRNGQDKDSGWTEEDQKILEEKLYTMFKEVVNCYK